MDMAQRKREQTAFDLQSLGGQARAGKLSGKRRKLPLLREELAGEDGERRNRWI
jgi:hypothetical protein